jgi:hypothetical protein
MGDHERRAYVETTWTRRRLDDPRRHDTIRLIRVVAPVEAWEVHRSGCDVVVRPNKSQALAVVAGIIGDAWVVTRAERRPARAAAA